MTDPVTYAEAKRFYEDFSPDVGTEDWLRPNDRHEQLKLIVGDLLGRRRGLDLLDVGCGAGVMSSYLGRYGKVTAVDFSEAAIALARRLVPNVTFLAGSLAAVPAGRFDVITMFDVLEHIPAAERPSLFGDLRERLADHGLLFISTPFPDYTAWRRERGDDDLQIIDELVTLPAVHAEAAAAGLQLVRYEAFDLWGGSPEYHAFAFVPATGPGGPAVLRPARLDRRMRWLRGPRVERARRLALAARALRHGRLKGARWLATAQREQRD